MKTVILTVDYEIFFGQRTGSVKECIIDPIKRLTYLLVNYDCSMTVFWDILHYYKMLQNEERYPDLKNERMLLEQQVSEMVRGGHDIQMHLHSHWLDAKYDNSKWSFRYERYRIHDLSESNDNKNINTIGGCIKISKDLIESVVKRDNPDYNVTTFRAGGYLIEPFTSIREQLLLNGINVDSSVCPGINYKNHRFSYNFRSYPSKIRYKFRKTPAEKSDYGEFVEVPITTVKIPVIKNLQFKLLRYKYLDEKINGTGVSYHHSKKLPILIKHILSCIFSPQYAQFTTDSNYPEKFGYIYKKVPDISTMILHSKYLNNTSLGLIESYLKKKKIRFISIKEYLLNCKQYE